VRLVSSLVASPAATEIFVVRDSSDNTTALILKACFNGTDDPDFNSTKIEYGSSATAGTTGIKGVTAEIGSSSNLINIIMDQIGAPTSGVVLANDAGSIYTASAFLDKSIEKSRVAIQFPISEITAARTSGLIPEAGSVDFKLKLSNAAHGDTLPTDFNVKVNPLTRAWNEGIGLDMESYSDTDASNWVSASKGVSWTTAGGDYNSSATYEKTFNFVAGSEDLDLDVTNIVEAWIAEDILEHGLLLRMTPTNENGSALRSYYTKKFFARGTEFFFKRPAIEAQFEDSIFDDRGNIFKSNSMAPAADNLNNIYLYNRHRGSLSDIPDTGSMLVVQMYSSSLGDGAGASPETLPVAGGVATASPTFVTASRVDTGTYKAQFAYTEAKTSLFDIWSTSSAGVATPMFTGSGFTVYQNALPASYEKSEYVASVVNMKDSYKNSERETFRLYTRDKNWKPNVYTVASTNAPVNNIREAYYKISRVVDDHVVIPYSTGSASGKSFSKMSYDISGSFFELDMSILESNYLYEMSFLFKDNDKFKELDEKFRFRVD